MRIFDILRLALLFAVAAAGHAQGPLPYSTYSTMTEMMEGKNAKYSNLIRVSSPGTPEHPAYTGFFFYQCLQWDKTGRYMLGMKIHVQNRTVEPADKGDIGYFDLKDGNKWTKIGETTAWNWQQGSRLQWRPESDEIVWNDRADDGKSFVARVYNFHTGKRRTLPRPVYAISPDGTTAMTHDFERMKHGGTDYVGIADRFENEFAPSGAGVWKMDMSTGKARLVLPLSRIATLMYPGGVPAKGCLYIFREGYNPSGTRMIVFVKESAARITKAFSMTPDGGDIRYLYNEPSHHNWDDDTHIMDWGGRIPPGGGELLKGYYSFTDDGSGQAKELLWETPHNGHNSYVPGPGGDWILSDTYSLDGIQHLFLYHRPTKLFVPIAKLKSTALMGIHRVDLHPRLSPDGRTVSIDSTYEGLGRQMYVVDIGHIVGNPSGRK